VKRREFVTLLGAWAATRSRIARAQQAPKIAKVGVLYPGLAAALSLRMTAFRDGLLGAGYREPDNIELIPRAANSDPARIDALAAELAERKVDVILAVSPAAVRASQAASATIPIVALDLESDPVATGLIKSLSRPGGQVTGMFLDFPEFGKKWLELLKETMPGLTKVAVLWDPATGSVQKTSVEIAGEALHVKLEVWKCGAPQTSTMLFARQPRSGRCSSYVVFAGVWQQSRADRGTYARTSASRSDIVSRGRARRWANVVWGRPDGQLPQGGCDPRRQGVARRQTRRVARRTTD
jgi:ABC-type uncharacterized transport system substrate-binding protein